MNREQKQRAIANLKEAVSSAVILVVAQNKGVNASQASSLRKEIRRAGGTTTVIKNTLAKLAVKDSECENVTPLLKGPTVILHSDSDPVALAKSVVGFAKENQTLELLGASMAGQFLDVNKLKALAELPSLDQLRGTIIGIIQAPAAKIARVINTPGEQIARVLKAYSEL